MRKLNIIAVVCKKANPQKKFIQQTAEKLAVIQFLIEKAEKATSLLNGLYKLMRSNELQGEGFLIATREAKKQINDLLAASSNIYNNLSNVTEEELEKMDVLVNNYLQELKKLY